MQVWRVNRNLIISFGLQGWLGTHLDILKSPFETSNYVFVHEKPEGKSEN